MMKKVLCMMLAVLVTLSLTACSLLADLANVKINDSDDAEPDNDVSDTDDIATEGDTSNNTPVDGNKSAIVCLNDGMRYEYTWERTDDTSGIFEIVSVNEFSGNSVPGFDGNGTIREIKTLMYNAHVSIDDDYVLTVKCLQPTSVSLKYEGDSAEEFADFMIQSKSFKTEEQRVEVPLRTYYYQNGEKIIYYIAPNHPEENINVYPDGGRFYDENGDLSVVMENGEWPSDISFVDAYGNLITKTYAFAEVRVELDEAEKLELRLLGGETLKNEEDLALIDNGFDSFTCRFAIKDLKMNVLSVETEDFSEDTGHIKKIFEIENGVCHTMREFVLDSNLERVYEYRENGILKKKTTYISGTCISSVFYDENGNPY